MKAHSRWKPLSMTVAILLVGGGVSVARTAQPVAVIQTDAYESNPAASPDFLAWDVWRMVNIVYARPAGGGPRMRVSPAGSYGWTGAIDGTTLIYQQASFQGRGRSDIFSFDLVTKTRAKLPGPINTKRWEYGPGRSGDLTAFGRWFHDESRKLYLHDASTGSLRVIASSSGMHKGLQVGQVNGDYVVYERWALGKKDRLRTCEVYRYDVQTKQTTRVPNPGPKCQFGPSVDPEGTVYFGRSGYTCGVKPELRAYPIGGPVSTVRSLPDGRDFTSTYAMDNGDGTTDVFFDPAGCRGDGDIYKVTTP